MCVCVCGVVQMLFITQITMGFYPYNKYICYVTYIYNFLNYPELNTTHT